MAERARINFLPDEADGKLLDELQAFYGGDAPGVIRMGLRAAKREMELLKHALKKAEAAKPPAAGKASAARKR